MSDKYHLSIEWKTYLELINLMPQYFKKGLLDIIIDENEIDEYYRMTKKKLGVVYKSEYHYMVVDLVRNGIGGRNFAYERLLPRNPVGSVVIIPIYQGSYVLLRQFRHALRKEVLAFPRGFGEHSVSAEKNAIKELQEELGVTDILKLRRIGKIAPDSGSQGIEADTFICEINQPQIKSGYEEILCLEILSPQQIWKAINSGEIVDGYTLAAMALLNSNS